MSMSRTRDFLVEGSGSHEVDAEASVQDLIRKLDTYGDLTVMENGKALGKITQASILTRISPDHTVKAEGAAP